MSEKKSFNGMRLVATVLANATAILSANYIVFYILDHFNPGFHFVVLSKFVLTQYLHLIIAGLAVLTGLIYLLLFTLGAFDRNRFNSKRLVRILVIDVILAGIFAMAVNTYAFDWLHFRKIDKAELQSIATLPPTPTPEPTPELTATPTPAPTDTPTPVPTDADGNPVTPAPTDTPVPTDTPEPSPEPTATPIPGLLGDKYAEKFNEGTPVIDHPNTQETLDDGTVRTLIYTYQSDKAAIDLYHYKLKKLEYQIADIYIRDITLLRCDYAVSQGDARWLTEFSRDLNAIISVNADYFSNNAGSSKEGLIIRNGYLIPGYNNPCTHSDLCVIYQDGTMRCFDCRAQKINNQEIIDSFPYHAFYFGPTLLDENGASKTKFNSTVGASNPRTAIGYYEPGHYAFISILGTRAMKDVNGRGLGNGTSPGMTFEEMSKLCASLGMTAAYNLDGGQSSGMYWDNQVFGHNNRVTGDMIAVIDPR